MGASDILTALVKGGMSPVGACAMGGNMMAESGMKANIAQRGLLVGLSDEQYTAAADTGTISFIADGVGYGLCQWTYHTRKADLWNFAKDRGKSVGDEETQVQFCIEELKNDFPELWKFLCETQNCYKATERICKEYERPAVNNVQTRYKYAKELYAQYGEIIENGEWRMDNAQWTMNCQLSTVNCQLEIRDGKTPEAQYLAALLYKLGYDVLWLGLDACLRDFQQKRGLDVDGVCGEKTWRELMK